MSGKRARHTDPEVFSGAGPRAERLLRHRAEVLRLVASYGGRDVHVFGSVARGDDHADSDIDLVFLEDRPVGLLASYSLNRALADLLGCPVDAFPARELGPATLDRISSDAVPL